MPDARPTAEESTAAFVELRNNLDYARSLISGGQHLDEQEKWPDILRWMVDTQSRLRAAITAVGGVPKTN